MGEEAAAAVVGEAAKAATSCRTPSCPSLDLLERVPWTYFFLTVCFMVVLGDRAAWAAVTNRPVTADLNTTDFFPLPGSFGAMTIPPAFPAWQDYASADPELLQEIVRQAEIRMQAQLQSALAADARAGLLSSLQAAASAGLFVAAAQADIKGSAEAAAYISASLLALGALLAACALRPIDFGFVGNKPSNWIDDIIAQETKQTGLAGTAEHLDKYLRLNDQRMSTNARLVSGSLFFLVGAPTASAVFLLFKHFCG